MAWTATERKLLAVLADGLPHAPAELTAAIDEMATLHNVRCHLSSIRRKLLRSGEWIDAVYHNRTLHYRHVRLLNGACLAAASGT